jgi:hypothetical protein
VTPQEISSKSYKYANVHTKMDCEAFTKALDMFDAEVLRVVASGSEESYEDGVEVVVAHVKRGGTSHNTYSSSYGRDADEASFSPLSSMRLPGTATVGDLKEAVAKSVKPYEMAEGSTAGVRGLQMSAKKGTSSNGTHRYADSAVALKDNDEKLLGSVVGGARCTLYVYWPDGEVTASLDLDKWAKGDAGPADAAGDCKNAAITLMDCLAKFSEREQLDESELWYCNKCKEHVRAFKQMSIWVPPPYLIIQLKRFSYRQSAYTSFHQRDKIDSLVHFPLEGLDLSPFVLGVVSRAQASGAGKEEWGSMMTYKT